MNRRIWLGGLAAGLMLFSATGGAIAQTSTENALIQEDGALEEGDSVLSSDNSLYDQFTFEGKAGQSVTITLNSSEFDTYLALVDPEGKVFAENDDISEQNLNSSITVTLPADGTYTVIANGYDQTSRGRYSIAVNVNQ